MICKYCGEEFTPGLKHPGYINVCLEQECRDKVHEPKTIVAAGDVAAIMQRKKRRVNGETEHDIVMQKMDW